MQAFKLLTQHRVRFILTSLSIALCSFLMMFLVSFYVGTSHGTMEYIRSADADMWVMQKHAVNILRNVSLLPSSYERDLRNMTGVERASPVFLIFASVKLQQTNASVYLVGFDPKTGVGGPPEIIDGRNITGDGEIVLDESFAKKYNIKTGDKIPIKNTRYTVTGLSSGTNMLVLQYAFISLHEAQNIAGIHVVVSCYLLKTEAGADVGNIAGDIREKFDNVSVFDKQTFLNNNVQELNSGVVPMLLVITLISAVVLTVILSLILYVNVLEKRKDFAIMKALGSPPGYIFRIVISQSVILALSGFAINMIIYFPLIHLIENISPEILTMTSPAQMLLVLSGVMLISVVSSILPNAKIRKIYPLEVFIKN